MTFGVFISMVWHSKLFWCLVLTYATAHIAKFITHRYRTKTWSFHTFIETGGMPSSHTATATALCVGIAFETAPSPLFFLAALFTIITIRDSSGVRRSVSEQARMLNSLTSHMNLHKKVKIVLGHTPFQVFVGVLLGLVVSISLYIF